MKSYFVYIMTNTWHTVLYTGMTGRGAERIQEHRNRMVPSFTSRYYLNKVVFAEAFSTPTEAAAAEKRIKGWTRKKKITLIESINPNWDDLLEEDHPLSNLLEPRNTKP
ncbi:MAG: GIY-YIG nuclease family protein [bacterium]